jgi:Helix-turn-helix domain
LSSRHREAAHILLAAKTGQLGSRRVLTLMRRPETARPEPQHFMTSTEVMALLRINRATLCRYCRRGLIPHLRMPDNSYRFPLGKLNEWLRQRSVVPVI